MTREQKFPIARKRSISPTDIFRSHTREKKHPKSIEGSFKGQMLLQRGTKYVLTLETKSRFIALCFLVERCTFVGLVSEALNLEI